MLTCGHVTKIEIALYGEYLWANTDKHIDIKPSVTLHLAKCQRCRAEVMEIHDMLQTIQRDRHL